MTNTRNKIARAMLVLGGDEGDLQPIDPAHLRDVLESLAQAGVANSRPMLKSTPHSAASINEVAERVSGTDCG